MNTLSKGLVLAAAHVVLLASTGAKMLYDRAAMPHAWIKTMAFDPNLPIRGRYLRLTLAADNPSHWTGAYVDLHVQGDRVVLGPAESNNANYIARSVGDFALISPPVAYFLSDKSDDPSRHLLDGQELWIDVTVPPHGHPRPIQLGIKHNGILTPIN